MRHLILMLLAAGLACGCSKSVDDKREALFDPMYEDAVEAKDYCKAAELAQERFEYGGDNMQPSGLMRMRMVKWEQRLRENGAKCQQLVEAATKQALRPDEHPVATTGAEVAPEAEAPATSSSQLQQGTEPAPAAAAEALTAPQSEPEPAPEPISPDTPAEVGDCVSLRYANTFAWKEPGSDRSGYLSPGKYAVVDSRELPDLNPPRWVRIEGEAKEAAWVDSSATILLGHGGCR